MPLADLMAVGLGEPGRKVTAVLAVLLTMGTMNTYMAAARCSRARWPRRAWLRPG